MNSCILMAEIIDPPQLRYTTDNLAVAEMMVQFPGPKPEDPPANLKVVGWGNLATEIEQRCHRGQQIIIEGRLQMNTIERKPEGFKEKRAELTAQKIHYLDGDRTFTPTTAAPTTAKNTPNFVSQEPLNSEMTAASVTTRVTPAPATNTATLYPVEEPKSVPSAKPTKSTNQPMPATPPDVDDIPF